MSITDFTITANEEKYDKPIQLFGIEDKQFYCSCGNIYFKHILNMPNYLRQSKHKYYRCTECNQLFSD